MKKPKSLIAIFSSIIIASSLATSLPAFAQKRNTAATIHNPQTKYYWCGPASMSQASYAWGKKINKLGSYLSQETCVNVINRFQSRPIDDVGETYFFQGGSTVEEARDPNNYPVVCAMNYYRILHRHTYKMFGPGTQTPNDSYTKNSIRSKIMATIDSGNCVLANGYNLGEDTKLTSYYPEGVGSDGHWITVYGYTEYANSLLINDPANGSPAIGGFENFNDYFATTIDRFYNFTNFGGKGIIY